MHLIKAESYPMVAGVLGGNCLPELPFLTVLRRELSYIYSEFQRLGYQRSVRLWQNRSTKKLLL